VAAALCLLSLGAAPALAEEPPQSAEDIAGAETEYQNPIQNGPAGATIQVGGYVIPQPSKPEEPVTPVDPPATPVNPPVTPVNPPATPPGDTSGGGSGNTSGGGSGSTSGGGSGSTSGGGSGGTSGGTSGGSGGSGGTTTNTTNNTTTTNAPASETPDETDTNVTLIGEGEGAAGEGSSAEAGADGGEGDYTIGGGDTPQAAGEGGRGGVADASHWSLLSLLLSAVAIAVSLLLLVGGLARRRDEEYDAYGYGGGDRHGPANRLKALAVAVGVLTPLLWLLLDDLGGPMAFVTVRTVYVAAAFAVHAAFTTLYMKRRRKAAPTRAAG
jgi:hypothetical protein